MAAGDFFNNMWLKVKNYAFPHLPHLKTVSELQDILTKLAVYSDSDAPDAVRTFRAVKLEEEFCNLREYCENHRQAILEALPALKEALQEFLAPIEDCEFMGATYGFWEELEKALDF